MYQINWPEHHLRTEKIKENRAGLDDDDDNDDDDDGYHDKSIDDDDD